MDYADFKLWFSLKGRVNRRPYFFTSLLVAAISESRKLVPDGFLIIYLPLIAVTLYVAVALGIKRCHDRNRTGWFMLVNFIPLICLWPLVELVFLKGTEGPNEYGPDPLAPPSASAP
jgi:uncharacterized membrane protein YhaH (DUF805 family)